jgi:sigma-B regulation protein RsbU (phosphoserine phosphatase)
MDSYTTGSDLELIPPVSAQAFRRASAWLGAHGRQRGIPTEQVTRLDLCLNEALANVVDHGGPAANTAPIRLHFSFEQLSDTCQASLTLTDRGVEFNPLALEAKPRPLSLENASPGGLGVAMIRNFSDDLSYHYLDGRNQFTFSVRWSATAQCVPNEIRPDVKVQHFNHGPDRRTTSMKLAHDRRQHGRDRRNMGVDWLTPFHGADKASVQAALNDSEVCVVSTGASLLQPGDTNDSIYVLLSGKLGVHLDNNQNPDEAIPILPGECIGELSAIDGRPVSAHVVALSDARVLKLAQDVFWNRLMVIPGVARNMLIGLSKRMRRSNEVMLEHQRKQLYLQHLRKELEVARQLQASMLPLHRPLFPERNAIEVAGIMEPASEVGGDLFDVFFVDDRHLFLCIGDVSGHGIPSAMFMARTIGLIRIAAMSTLYPDQLLRNINEQLCTNNDTNLFVTLFCAFLDTGSGRLVYSNAGHCPPFLLKEDKAGQLPIPKGTLVGAIPDLSYTAFEIVLHPGEVLVCFTDGVTEAQTRAGEEFSEERLGKALERLHSQPLETMMDKVRQEVNDFTGVGVLDDDLTLLSIRLTSISTQGKG